MKAPLWRSTEHMTHTAKILSLTEKRGSLRFWSEGRAPAKSGFTPGRKFVIVRDGPGLVLKLDPAGDRTVSAKELRSGTVAPVIDINSARELAPLAGLQQVRVLFGKGVVRITAPSSELRRLRRLNRLRDRLTSGDSLRTAGIAAGGGVLTHALSAGLTDAGIAVSHALHNEIREDLCEQAVRCNEALSPATQVLNMPLQELAFDQDVLSTVEEVDVVELGLPCSGASKAGRAKRIIRMPEEHPEVGHLVVGALALLARLNPVVAVFENVPAYRTTASAALIRQQMQALGYSVHERLLYGPEFGELEQRNRWCLVGVTRGVEFDIEALPLPLCRVRTLSEVLEPLSAVEGRWSEMPGLVAKQARNRAEGHNFKMQVFDGTEPGIGTLTKGISKNRSTDPKIRHPENPRLLRVPTPREHARCKGVPEHLVDGLSATTAHELLGQGVAYAPFRHLARHIGTALKAWAARPQGLLAQGSSVPLKAAA